MSERLTPRTEDLEVWGSSLARRALSLEKECYSTLSLFTHVYKWVLATYFWGLPCDGSASRPGESSNLREKLRPFGPLAPGRLYLVFIYLYRIRRLSR